MGAERRDVVSDGPLIVLGRKGCPARQERRGKGSGNEKSSTESHGLLLFFVTSAGFQRGKVKSLCIAQGSQRGEAVAFSPNFWEIFRSLRCEHLSHAPGALFCAYA
jgi:hypothetical protein